MSVWRHAVSAWLIIAACLIALEAPWGWALGGSAIAVGMAFGMHLLLEKIDDSIHRR